MIIINSYRGVTFHNEWIEKVIIQLNRDLSLAGFDKKFNERLSLSDFQLECLEFFELLLVQNEQQLYNLLYRIDVDQKKIHKDHEKPQVYITQLVLEREFQKVVLKSQFS